MSRHHQLPPAAARRKQKRRPRNTDHYRLPVIDDGEADLLATAYAAYRDAAGEANE